MSEIPLIGDRDRDEDLCGRCGRRWLDHTLLEMRAHHPAEDLNFGFEKHEPIYGADTGALSSAMVVQSATVPNPTGGRPYPGLVFTFKDPDGLSDAAKVILVLTEEQLRKAGELVIRAIETSIGACRG